MMPTLMRVVQFWRLELFRVPQTFTAVTTAIITTERTVFPTAESGMISARCSVKARASAATEPAGNDARNRHHP